MNIKHISILVVPVIFAAFAQAQYIKIETNAIGQGHTYRSLTTNLVFDTDQDPDIDDDGNYVFLALTGDSAGMRLGTLPWGTRSEQDINSLNYGTLTYDPTEQSLFYHFSSENHLFLMRWGTATDWFFKGMNALPTNPEAFFFADPNGDAWIQVLNGPLSSSWTSGEGFSDSNQVVFTVTVSDTPPALSCSPADLNADGEINFFDVSVFIETYLNGCP